jgi:hypothetical protein
MRCATASTRGSDATADWAAAAAPVALRAERARLDEERDEAPDRVERARVLLALVPLLPLPLLLRVVRRLPVERPPLELLLVERLDWLRPDELPEPEPLLLACGIPFLLYDSTRAPYLSRALLAT